MNRRFSVAIRVVLVLVLVACTGPMPLRTAGIIPTTTPALGTKSPLTPLSTVIVPTEPNNGFAAGRTLGQGSVTADGMASYNIPLWVPPGRLGIQPELSLSYNSAGGNGPLGVGWTLNGFSQITRCRRTFVQDGEAREVRFLDGADGDRYCLNGQRLVAVGTLPGMAGIYGGNETEYRLENDAHIKIVSYAPDEYGPTYFRAYLKDGRILTLGGTNDSNLEGQRVHVTSQSIYTTGGTPSDFEEYEFFPDYSQHVRYAWSLSRMEDRNGNLMTVHYWMTGYSPLLVSIYTYQQLPDMIEYTSSSSDPTLSPTRFVKFLYEPRPDVEEYYVGGFRVATGVRLKSVEMSWGSDPMTTAQLLRRYELQYRNNSISGRSLLSQVMECDGAGVCLAPTQFDWSLGSGTYHEVYTHIIYDISDVSCPISINNNCYLSVPYDGHLSIADRDGNGHDEIIIDDYLKCPGPVARRYPIPRPRYVDLNADGRKDRIALNLPPCPPSGLSFSDLTYVNEMILSAVEGDQIIEDPVERYDRLQRPAYALDLNGDGLPDLVKALNIPSTEKYIWGIRWNSNGSFGDYEKTSLEVPFDPNPALGQIPMARLAIDLNGSGKMSLLGDRGALGLVNGKISLESTNWRNFCSDSVFLDANGDGLSDWLFYEDPEGSAPIGTPSPNISPKISLNTGNGFTAPAILNIPFPKCGASLSVHDYIIDYNGDGRDDLLGLNTAGGTNLEVHISTPTGFAAVELPMSRSTFLTTLDYNGDGMDDIATVRNNNISIWTRLGGKPDLLTNVKDGLGAFERFEYQPISDSSVYKAVTDCTYPQFCLKGKLWVVARHWMDTGNDYPKVDIRRDVQDEAESILSSLFASRFVIPPGWNIFSVSGIPVSFIYPPSWEVNSDDKEITLKRDGHILRIAYGQLSINAPSWIDPYAILIDSSTTEREEWANNLQINRQKLFFDGKLKRILYDLPSVRGLDFAARLDGSSDPGPRPTEYTYVDGRIDLAGRGWLGFAQRIAFDPWLGIQTSTAYDNKTRMGTAYPCGGYIIGETVDIPLEAGLRQRRAAAAKCEVISQWGGKVYFAYTSSIRASEWEGTGPDQLTLLRLQEIIQTQDIYGNITSQQNLNYAVQQGLPTGRASQWKVSTAYDNFPASWLIGQARRVETTSSDRTGRSVTRTDEYEYYANSGLLRKTFREPDEAASDYYLETTLERDKQGQITSLRYTSSDQTREEHFVYDSEDIFLNSYMNPLGHVTEFIYHQGMGLLAATRDPNGLDSKYQYDGFGRVRLMDVPDNSDTSFGYNLNTSSQMVVTSQQGGHSPSEETFDRLGREIENRSKAFDGRWISVETVYDPFGRKASISIPHFVGDPAILRRFEYDPLGRLRFVYQPEGEYQETVYEGLTTTHWDEKRNQSYIIVDELGRVTSSVKVDTHEIITNYEYGPFNQLERVTLPENQHLTMDYDRLGQITESDDIDLGIIQSRHNAFGELIRQIDGNGTQVDYAYDAMSRIKTIKDPQGETSFIWDNAANGIGQLAHTSSPDGIDVSFLYDSFSRVKRATWTVERNNYAYDYSYDQYSRLDFLSYPQITGNRRLRLHYIYTAEGYLKRIEDAASGQQYWELTSTNPYGQSTEERFGNGLITNRQYNPRGWLRFIDTRNSSRALVQSLEFRYEDNGNLYQRYDRTPNSSGTPLRVEEFSYDPLDRLIDWDLKQLPNIHLRQRYHFGDSGNLLMRQIVAGPGNNETYTYGENGAGLHAVTKIEANTTAVYAYDDSGDQLSGPNRTVAYTSFHLPKSIQTASGKTTFFYDALRMRVLKRNSSGETLSIGSLYERRKSGGSTNHVFYIQAVDRIVAQVNWTVSGGGNLNQEVLYFHDSNLGTLDMISGENGKVIARMAFDPFGKRLDFTNLGANISNAPADVRLGFTSLSHDDDLGLINMLGRIYDPVIGRFLTGDPFINKPTDSESYNHYSYALNNSLRHRDPSGFQSYDVVTSAETTDRGFTMTGYTITYTGSGCAGSSCSGETIYLGGIPSGDALRGEITGGGSDHADDAGGGGESKQAISSSGTAPLPASWEMHLPSHLSPGAYYHYQPPCPSCHDNIQVGTLVRDKTKEEREQDALMGTVIAFMGFGLFAAPLVPVVLELAAGWTIIDTLSVKAFLLCPVCWSFLISLGNDYIGVSRIPLRQIPGVPPGMTRAKFGELMWGTGPAGAMAKMREMTPEMLKNIGVTRQMALEWAEHYEWAANVGRGGATAVYRAQIMREAADILAP
jgi:RHS repeat-associated protein